LAPWAVMASPGGRLRTVPGPWVIRPDVRGNVPAQTGGPGRTEPPS
jgi:hypothetical protein